VVGSRATFPTRWVLAIRYTDRRVAAIATERCFVSVFYPRANLWAARSIPAMWIVLLILPLALVNPVAAASGQVQGKILLESDSSPLSGATITLVPINISVAPLSATPISGSNGGSTGSGAATATTTSGKDGTFSVSGLAPGQFAICVKDPLGTVTDPCAWRDSRTTVTVVANSPSTGVVVRVKKASVVRIRLNDAIQALAKKATDSAPPHVLVGAFDLRGMFHPALEVHKDSTGTDYQLAIPVDSPIRMTVYSTQIKLADSVNTAISSQGFSGTFVQISSDSQTKTFTFNTVGRN
jgi:hypothetical protein